MPNWPLSEGIRSYLRDRANEIAGRVVNLAESGFPLTRDQVQYMVMPEEHVTTLTRLEHEGVKTITRHNSLHLAFFPTRHGSLLPKLNRAIAIAINLPENAAIYVPRSTVYLNFSASLDDRNREFLMPIKHSGSLPEEGVITEHDLKRLDVWLDGALRQQRLLEIVRYIVPEILDLAASTQHLATYWPLLTKLMNPTPTRYDNAAFHRQWVERFRHPVRRNALAYQPSEMFWTRYRRLIEAAEVILQSGLLLDSSNPKRGQPVIAEIKKWKRLERDLKFPLEPRMDKDLAAQLVGKP